MTDAPETYGGFGDPSIPPEFSVLPVPPIAQETPLTETVLTGVKEALDSLATATNDITGGSSGSLRTVVVTGGIHVTVHNNGHNAPPQPADSSIGAKDALVASALTEILQSVRGTDRSHRPSQIEQSPPLAEITGQVVDPPSRNTKPRGQQYRRNPQVRASENQKAKREIQFPVRKAVKVVAVVGALGLFCTGYSAPFRDRDIPVMKGTATAVDKMPFIGVPEGWKLHEGK